MIVQRSGERWVLDAKYKLGFGDEARIDRFQMCAYVLAFEADRASLVYPTATIAPGVRRLLSTVVFGRRIPVDASALPMAAGPARCRELLSEIIRTH